MGLLSLVLATTLAAAPAPVDEAAIERASNAWTGELIRRLSTSTSPRDRALSTLLRVFPPVRETGDAAHRGAILREAAQAAPGDRLVQWLWASVEEDESGCDAAHPCPERLSALSRLEPENAAAWIPMAAAKGADAATRDAVLANLRRADHSDFMFPDMVAALMDAYRRNPMPEATRRVLASNTFPESRGKETPSATSTNAVSAIAIAAAMPWRVYELHQHCKLEAKTHPDSVVVSDCRHLGRLMAQAPSIIERMLGLALLRETGAENAEARRALEWLAWNSSSPATGLNDSSAEFERYVEDLLSTRSEIRASELVLQRHGISVTPPAGWKRPDPAAAATMEPERPGKP